MKAVQKRHSTLRRVWAVPALLATLNLYGLLMALLGSGIWRELAWIALALPVLVILNATLRKTGSEPERKR